MLFLGEQLEKMGHEVQYFGMYDDANTVGNRAGLYTQNMDFHSTGLKRFLYPFKIIFSFEAKRKILKVIDDFKPDIIHMNNINFQLTPSVIYGAKKRGIPVVQTVHDYQMICPNHLLYNFRENIPCEKCIEGSYIDSIKNIVNAILAIDSSYTFDDLFTLKMIVSEHAIDKMYREWDDYFPGKTKPDSEMVNIALNKIYEAHKEAGLEIYQVSVDDSELLWKEAAENLPWITVYNSKADGANNLLNYNVTLLPMSYVIDRNGELVERIDDVNQLEKAIKKYL